MSGLRAGEPLDPGRRRSGVPATPARPAAPPVTPAMPPALAAEPRNPWAPHVLLRDTPIPVDPLEEEAEKRRRDYWWMRLLYAGFDPRLSVFLNMQDMMARQREEEMAELRKRARANQAPFSGPRRP